MPQHILTRLTHWANQLANHYPVAGRWLAGRLATTSFTGLPLTVLSIGLLISIATLSEVAENIVNTEPMVRVDLLFTQWLFQGRSSSLSTLFYGLTWLGSAYVTVGLAIMGSVVLLRQHQRQYVFILWLLLAGVSLFVQVGKWQFIRPRPLSVAYYHEVGFSFPSGHSATALTLYGLLAYWWIRWSPGTRSRVWIGAGAISLILAVGFSRIYLGVHYLSDVLDGYLLGICWLIVGIVLTEWERTRPQIHQDL